MREIRPAIMMLIVFTVICGAVYPALVTAIAQSLFPGKAMGSLITDREGRVVGSALIGQPFSGPGYFWPRPSATPDFPYNPMASGGSNSGPTNPDYLKTVAGRVSALRESGVKGAIPADLVQASASGLDPHVSLAAAELQVPRVAKARGMTEASVRGLVAAHGAGRQLGFLGEARVNVLELNLDLDGVGRTPPGK